jgi:hypothetical protein
MPPAPSVVRMSTTRRFCRFSRSAEGNEFGLRWEEPGGFCLSAFLVLTEAARPASVLLGRMNPTAPWDHLGGLNPERVEAHRHGWVLPASNLLLRESPDEAARRVLAEMLGGGTATLAPARVFSEVYTPRRFPQIHNHWDVFFVYPGHWTGAPPAAPDVWSELRFVDLTGTKRSDFARSHDEVLEAIGLPVPGP